MTRDDDRFTEFFGANQQRALRLAYLLTGDRQLAEDIAAEAFARVLARWSDDIRDPGAYLRRAVVNTVNSSFRRRGTERRMGPLLHVPTDDRDRVAGGVVDRDVVLAALAQLPPQQRTVLVLRYYDDRSEAEIARILGISAGSVKSNASRGLARLRELVSVSAGMELAA